MQQIENHLNKIEIGEPIRFKGLTMFPLAGLSDSSIDYLTLDEALKDGTASISEISEEGSVPDLKFLNTGDKPVFLLDGEELVGAKQNRILNLSILVPAQSEVTIPVSCVEQGRWSYRSDRFHSSDRSYFSKGRAMKNEYVSDSLAQGKPARSNQSEIWKDVSELLRSSGVSSSSEAMADIFEAKKGEVDDFVETLQPIPGQVGAAFVLNGKAAGLDLFDNSSTLRRLLHKLVRSYALDALIERRRPSPVADVEDIKKFIVEMSSCSMSSSPSIGMGEDYRFADSRTISGGALIVDADIIHVCAFPSVKQTSEGGQFLRTSMARASDRRRMH